MQEGRVKNSVRNVSFSLIYYAIQILLTFLVRILFVRVFVSQYLGVNTLFTNILNILSVVESGFGSAIVFALFKPVAENDEEKVRQLVQLYKKYYTIIGSIVLVLGLLLIPFLPYLIKDFYSIDLNLYLMFLIFLATSVITYITAHRRALFYTTQRSDIETKINIVAYITTITIQLLSILVFKNYYIYAIAGLINVIVISVLIVVISNKKYKSYLLKPSSPIDKSESKNITKNVFALFYHKIGGIVLNATDSLILAAFIGSVVVGKYSNYLLITTSLNTLMNIFVGSIKGSVGNLIATEDVEKNHKLFNDLNKAFIIINTFICICFISLVNPFVSFFFGQNMLLSFGAVIVIGLNMYLYNLRQVVYTFKDCKGLFKENKYAPLIEAVINLILSIILVKFLGLTGVLLGTIISCILVPLWNEPYILFKHYFKKSTTIYMLKLILNICLYALVGCAVLFIIHFIPHNSLPLLILKFASCGLLTLSILLIVSIPSKSFRSSVNYVKQTVKNFINKK